MSSLRSGHPSHYHVRFREVKYTSDDLHHNRASKSTVEEEKERHEKTRPGLFGRAEHRFEDNVAYETRKEAYEEEDDVNMAAGEYIKRKHDKLSTEMLQSIKG